jgi:hypothetical protein
MSRSTLFGERARAAAAIQRCRYVWDARKSWGPAARGVDTFRTNRLWAVGFDGSMPVWMNRRRR